MAAGRARGEDRYFHKAPDNLSGQGPGLMIGKLVLAAADGPGAAGGPGPWPAGAGGPAGAVLGQLAGGGASLLKIEDSKTGPGSESESEPLADQDLPEQDSASGSEASQPADPGEYIVKYCEIL